MFARDHSLEISPFSIDCWKRWANTGPTSVANPFRIRLISGVIHGTGETERLVFEGMRLSAES